MWTGGPGPLSAERVLCDNHSHGATFLHKVWSSCVSAQWGNPRGSSGWRRGVSCGVLLLLGRESIPPFLCVSSRLEGEGDDLETAASGCCSEPCSGMSLCTRPDPAWFLGPPCLPGGCRSLLWPQATACSLHKGWSVAIGLSSTWGRRYGSLRSV